ncbi:MAG TPA: cytochrome c class I [Ferruginibacter sp.]|nr:cytochrome c class I [Ferruginibacter sp.]HMP19850.1 cytochrome c class I [Ferruginibacter sp.]
MKKFFISAAVAAVLFSCGASSDSKEATAADPAEAKAAPATNPLEDKALALIGQSDCITCHKINESVTGPAYIDVANKYDNTPANVEMLVEKVLKGGKGNWGEVPMLAHPALSKEDATIMVEYILSLKK